MDPDPGRFAGKTFSVPPVPLRVVTDFPINLKEVNVRG
jgi:hypothetical protein